jgi:hypothetical protein
VKNPAEIRRRATRAWEQSPTFAVRPELAHDLLASFTDASLANRGQPHQTIYSRGALHRFPTFVLLSTCGEASEEVSPHGTLASSTRTMAAGFGVPLGFHHN